MVGRKMHSAVASIMLYDADIETVAELQYGAVQSWGLHASMPICDGNKA